LIGFFKGILPGAGATISTMISYSVEKMIAKHPEEFGKGAIQGVAGPEAANNAATGGAMIPLLTLGVPGTSTTAIMLGAMMMWGLRPGPLLFQNNPDFVWGIIASMYIGNIILLILNFPLVPLFAQTLKTPSAIMYALIVLICIIGTYSLNSSLFDLWLLLIFGVIGYLLKKLDFPLAPAILAMVLGPLLERSLYQSLTMSQGNLFIFFQRPISAVMMGLSLLLFLFPVIRWLRRSKVHLATNDEE
jgi:putative tricarboxylic transport membrane protein